MATDAPRGTCPVCDRPIRLIPSSGLVRRHIDRGSTCQGSWELPKSMLPNRERDLAYRVSALEAVLRDREAELLELKGPCSYERCCLHYAHSGPCNTTRALTHPDTTEQP